MTQMRTLECDGETFVAMVDVEQLFRDVADSFADVHNYEGALHCFYVADLLTCQTISWVSA